MRHHPCFSTRRQKAGYSLVEVLVGIVIGAVALLAIAQTVVVFDKHTQTTSSGGDAQMAGALAMFSLERDIKQAGLGFGGADAQTMGCEVQAQRTTPAGTFTFALSPVRIEVGAAGASDTVHVLYGNSSIFVTSEQFNLSTASTKRLARRGGFRSGDLAVVAGNPGASAASATCHLIEITAATDPDGIIAHATGSYASSYSAAASAVARFNPAGGTGAVYGAGGNIYNLGPEPQWNTWRVQDGALLRRTRIDRDETLEVAEGVVNLKAQYGVDIDANGRITEGEWTTAEPANWNQVLAIRVALLVRSRQFERNGDPSASAPAPVTAAAPTWSASASAPFAMTDVSGGTRDSFSNSPNTPDPANWRFYRYRVYERVIPLRNTIWGQ